MGRFHRRDWLLVVLGLLLAVVVALSIVLPQQVKIWHDKLTALAAAFGWVLFVAQYAYFKSERFYVWVSSLRLWLTNEPTIWNFTVDLNECAKLQPLDTVWEVIKQARQEAMLWHRDESSLIVNMPGYTLRVFVPSEAPFHETAMGQQGTICIQVSDLELPFRTFRTKIEQETIPLIQGIATTLKPETEKYAAKIMFSARNPYFGFFVRRLDLPRVVSFTCDIIESPVGSNDQVVTVRKDQIEIITDNVLALQNLSAKYVRLVTN